MVRPIREQLDCAPKPAKPGGKIRNEVIVRSRHPFEKAPAAETVEPRGVDRGARSNRCNDAAACTGPLQHDEQANDTAAGARR